MRRGLPKIKPIELQVCLVEEEVEEDISKEGAIKIEEETIVIMVINNNNKDQLT